MLQEFTWRDISPKVFHRDTDWLPPLKIPGTPLIVGSIRLLSSEWLLENGIRSVVNTIGEDGLFQFLCKVAVFSSFRVTCSLLFVHSGCKFGGNLRVTRIRLVFPQKPAEYKIEESAQELLRSLGVTYMLLSANYPAHHCRLLEDVCWVGPGGWIESCRELCGSERCAGLMQPCLLLFGNFFFSLGSAAANAMLDFLQTGPSEAWVVKVVALRVAFLKSVCFHFGQADELQVGGSGRRVADARARLQLAEYPKLHAVSRTRSVWNDDPGADFCSISAMMCATHCFVIYRLLWIEDWHGMAHLLLFPKSSNLQDWKNNPNHNAPDQILKHAPFQESVDISISTNPQKDCKTNEALTSISSLGNLFFTMQMVHSTICDFQPHADFMSSVQPVKNSLY